MSNRKIQNNSDLDKDNTYFCLIYMKSPADHSRAGMAIHGVRIYTAVRLLQQYLVQCLAHNRFTVISVE